jgi:hypothetical protein
MVGNVGNLLPLGVKARRGAPPGQSESHFKGAVSPTVFLS